MAKAIVEGMEKERDAGNMDLGQVGKEGIEKPVSKIQEVVPEVAPIASTENLVPDISIVEDSVVEAIEDVSPELEVLDLSDSDSSDEEPVSGSVGGSFM